MSDWYPLLFDPGSADQLRVVERAGAIVSHAGFALFDAQLAERTARVACFGAVFTLPRWRGQGMASAALADAVTVARARGAEFALISGDRPLYARLGFRPISPARRTRGIAPGAAHGLRVRRAGLDDAAALAALYDTQLVRFRRSPRDWARLLAARVVMFGPGDIWIVEDAAAGPCGYLAVQRSPGRAPQALEVVGDQAVAAAPAVASALGVPLDLVLPTGYPTQCISRAGLVAREERFPFLAAVWDPAWAGAEPPWYGLNYV